MTRYSRVVVGTDGSATADRAVARAVALSQRAGLPLTVATAWYRHSPDGPVPSELAEWPGTEGGHHADWAAKTASDAAARARAVGVPVEVETPLGAPADALVALVSADPDALLVVGSWGLGSRAERLVGNVPHQISHHSPTDVLLVATTEDTHPDAAYRTVALATDGSDTAARAVARGLGLARALGAEAHLLTAARDHDAAARGLERARASLPDGATVDDEVAVLGSSVTEALAEAARRYDLLVLGNKGMSGPSRLLGSVANDVTHRVPTDLLLVNTTRR